MTISELFASGFGIYVIAVILLVPCTILGAIASLRVNLTYRAYSRVQSKSRMTAEQAARAILDAEGVVGVTIRRISGKLTDNYNPKTHVLSLSSSVYGSTSVAAIGVACHEAGHAIQHARKYAPAMLRLKLVGAVNAVNRMLLPILIIGYILGLGASMGLLGDIFICSGLIVFGASLLFNLATLPSEFDASRRALKLLTSSGILEKGEVRGARKVLKAAAMTYVTATLTVLLQFLRFFGIALMRTSNRR